MFKVVTQTSSRAEDASSQLRTTLTPLDALAANVRCTMPEYECDRGEDGNGDPMLLISPSKPIGAANMIIVWMEPSDKLALLAMSEDDIVDRRIGFRICDVLAYLVAC